LLYILDGKAERVEKRRVSTYVRSRGQIEVRVMVIFREQDDYSDSRVRNRTHSPPVWPIVEAIRPS
jgi:hypothetical protein